MGLATAKLTVNNGFRVIIASRSQAKLDAALNKIDSQNATAYRVDTLDEKSTAELFEKVGIIDHLVITAAETDFLSIKTSSANEVKGLFDSRYFGPFRVIQAALEHMDPAGSITLFSGTAGVKAIKEYEVLASISAAIDGLARTLALTLAPIRVNSISPGLIDTPAIRSDSGGDDDATAVGNEMPTVLADRVAHRGIFVSDAMGLVEEGGSGLGPAEAAARLGVSTSQLVALLRREPTALQTVNTAREQLALRPLR